MALKPVLIGAYPNDRSGDAARTAFEKLNSNDAELYEAVAQIKSPSELIASGAVAAALSARSEKVEVASTALNIIQATEAEFATLPARLASYAPAGNGTTDDSGNSASADTVAIASAKGLHLWSRQASTGYERALNGQELGTATRASTAQTNLPFRICGQNHATTPTFYAGPVRGAFWGAGLSSSDRAALYARLNAYYTAGGVSLT